MRQVATIVFRGTFRPAAFLAFAAHRARRLDLETRVGAAVPETITVTVEGEADLIDAFEMACSLGPIDCLVSEVRRSSGPGAAPGERR